jgi:hypothetical protein
MALLGNYDKDGGCENYEEGLTWCQLMGLYFSARDISPLELCLVIL